MKYYSNNNNIKYDYILHPGSSISDINVKFEGVLNISANSAKDSLKIETKLGTFFETMPLVYQKINGKINNIKCEYSIINNTVSYDVQFYNPSYDLIIDPSLTYASYFGGNGDDYFLIGDAAVDNQGNIYTTGATTSVLFPTTPGTYNSVYAGGLTDIFVLKFDSNGSLLVSTYIGGNDYDFGFGIDIDINGNPVLGGDSWSGNFPTTPGTYQPVHSTVASTNGDITVTIFNPNLNTIVNSTFIGGVQDEQPHELIAGSNGNIYLGGQARAGMPTTPGCYQSNCISDYDYFASIISVDLSTLIASTYIGGGARDRGNGIALDNNYNLYLTAYVEGTFPTTPGAFDVTYSGGTSDVTVVKFNPNLTNLIYSTYLGGNSADLSQSSIEVINGEAIITGTTSSSNFPATAGSYSTTLTGGSDVFVSKINLAGTNLIYSTLIGSTGTDQGWNIFVNSNNEILLTGNCSDNFPTTNCTYDNSFNGGANDAFISIFNSDFSSLLYSSYYGGSADESGRIILEIAGKRILLGNTNSSNIDLATSPFDSIYNGSRDIFLSIFDQSVQPAIFSYNNACLNSPTNFSSEPGTISAQWDFGDPASGTGNTSNGLNPSHTFSNAGTFTVTYIGTNACGIETITQNVTIAPQLITNTIPDTTICSGSILLLTASGGTDYVWNNSITSNNDSVSVSPTINTQYIVFAQTSGCAAVADTVNVNVINTPTVTITGDSAICNGNSITLVAAGTSVSFQWSGPINSTNDTIVIFPSNNTTVYLQSIGSVCGNSIDSLNLIVSNPAITVAGPDTLVCPNSNLLLTASGGTSYVWNNGITSLNDSVFVNINSDSIFVVYALSPGCPIFADTINVSMAPHVLATITGDSTACVGENITLVASGNSTSYQWSGVFSVSNDSISFIANNNITIYLTGTSGLCNSPLDSMLINVDNLPTAAFTNSVTLCANTNINFNSLGINATNYNWNFGDSINNPLYFSFQQNPTHSYTTVGTYMVTLIAGNSCGSDTAVQSLTIGLGPNAILPNDSNICAGQQITLVSNGGTQAVWSGGISSNNDSITVSPIENTIYTLTISDGICFGLSDTINIIVDSPISVQIVGDNNLYCPGDSVKLYGSGGNNIVWTFNGNVEYDNPITLTPNASGMVYASNTSSVCPLSLDSFYVSVATKSNADFSYNIDSCLNRIFLKNNSTAASNYKWEILNVLNSNEVSPYFDINDVSEFDILLIANPNSNCADTVTKSISLDSNFGNNFFIPNTFTPNNDAINDEFTIGTWNQCKNFKLFIYNRWGNLIHQTEGSKVKWDGKFKGIDVPTGVYVYLLQIGEIEKTGTVTLYR